MGCSAPARGTATTSNAPGTTGSRPPNRWPTARSTPRSPETEPGAGPERKRYKVTDAGRQSVKQWLLTPVTPAGDVQADIFAKTVIALMLDDDAGRLLDLQRAEHMARMRELTRLKQDGDLRTVLLADHALFHIEADLRWMETTAARLGELRTEVRS